MVHTAAVRAVLSGQLPAVSGPTRAAGAGRVRTAVSATTTASSPAAAKTQKTRTSHTVRTARNQGYCHVSTRAAAVQEECSQSDC